jgi:alpha-mannosidase
MSYIFHLIPNAHLDPVWLWDWREGLNEGIITCRAVLDMMDEIPDLTFIRGEATIYRHIERTDPETFARIKKYVKNGRWEIVGGTEIQPDTNLPATETFCRQYLHGKQYFREKFGKEVTVAWAADSFGHSGGMPEILAACGMDGFCFTRPAYDIVPIEKSAFWWEGFGGSRVLAYRPRFGWYGAERHEMPARLDQLLDAAGKSDLVNVGVLFGLGNHGGGPSRRQIDDIRKWGEKHPEVKLQFSGLHRLLGAIRDEVKKGRELPVHKGELNFVLRGCYSSVAKYKFLYRQAENMVQRAEVASTIISTTQDKSAAERQDKIRAAWDAVLFNSFHDILPGSSIERALDEQIQRVGGAIHVARGAEFDALNSLAAQIDTRVAKPQAADMPGPVAILVWNPHPWKYDGYIELEASLDYRPIWSYQNRVAEFPVKVTGADGKAAEFQIVDHEHRSMPLTAWRRRIVTKVQLPALGWNLVQMAWVEEFKPEKIDRPTVAKKNSISNSIYEIRAVTGAKGVRIKHRGRDLFGRNGLQIITVEDPWGSWGGMAEEKDATTLKNVLATWEIKRTEILESGPLRASLWVQLEAGNSRLGLTFMLCRDREVIDVRARMFINERSVRVKMVMAGCDQAELDVPAGSVVRGEMGQMPGGRWARALQKSSVIFGLATDGLYDFDIAEGSLRATICRASRYGDDVKTTADEVPWRPAVDAGELKFNFVISPGGEELPRLTEELERPPVSIFTASHPGQLRKSGSLGEIALAGVQLLALKPAEDGNGIIVRLFNRSERATKPTLRIGSRKIGLTTLPAGKIGTWRIGQNGKSVAISAAEIGPAQPKP